MPYLHPYFRTLGPARLARWQARVVLGAVLEAPVWWLCWVVFWSIRGWPR